MIVKTNLRGGGLVSNTAQTACDLCNHTTSFLKHAEQEANTLAAGVSAATQKIWNCLDKAFNQ